MNARERIVEQFEMSQMAKNGVNSYGTIELPKKVIVRIESVRGEIESTKQPKIREEVPPEPKEWIGINGRKNVKMAEKTRIIRIEKQPKIREEVMVPPKPEERIGINGRRIAKRQENAPIEILINANRIITKLHTRIPIIYYVIMAFGLVSAIFGAVTSYPVSRAVILGGISIFLVAFTGFLEVIYKRRSLKITG